MFNYVIKFSDEQLNGTWTDDNSGYLTYLNSAKKKPYRVSRILALAIIDTFMADLSKY